MEKWLEQRIYIPFKARAALSVFRHPGEPCLSTEVYKGEGALHQLVSPDLLNAQTMCSPVPGLWV